MCDTFWVLTYPSWICADAVLNLQRGCLTLCCRILPCKTSACQLTPCSRRGHRTSAAKLSWCMPHGMGFCGTYPAGNVPYLKRESERHDRWSQMCPSGNWYICHPVKHFLSRWYDPRWTFRGPGCCKRQSWRCWTLPIWTVLQILPGWSFHQNRSIQKEKSIVFFILHGDQFGCWTVGVCFSLVGWAFYQFCRC